MSMLYKIGNYIIFRQCAYRITFRVCRSALLLVTVTTVSTAWASLRRLASLLLLLLSWEGEE